MAVFFNSMGRIMQPPFLLRGDQVNWNAVDPNLDRIVLYLMITSQDGPYGADSIFRFIQISTYP